jgi:hypothetical protein
VVTAAVSMAARPRHPVHLGQLVLGLRRSANECHSILIAIGSPWFTGHDGAWRLGENAGPVGERDSLAD